MGSAPDSLKRDENKNAELLPLKVHHHLKEYEQTFKRDHSNMEISGFLLVGGYT